MEKKLKQIMRGIKANVPYKEDYKIITVFLLSPKDERRNRFEINIIAGIKKNAMCNNYTQIFYNDTLQCSTEEFEELLDDAIDRYRVEPIIPETWREVNRFWWAQIESVFEIIEYANSANDWKRGKVGFRIIQKF